jgi:hypothetical protein
VMLDHPGVICYHVDYPSEGVSKRLRVGSGRLTPL